MFGRVPTGSPTRRAGRRFRRPASRAAMSACCSSRTDPLVDNTDAADCSVHAGVSVGGRLRRCTGSTSAPAVSAPSFHITRSFPVSCVRHPAVRRRLDLLPSSELLLPTSAWGTNYVTGRSARRVSGPRLGPGRRLRGQHHGRCHADGRRCPAEPDVAAAPAKTTTSYTLKPASTSSGRTRATCGPGDHSRTTRSSYTGGTGYLCLGSSTSSGGGCDSGHQLIAAGVGARLRVRRAALRDAPLEPPGGIDQVPAVGAAAGTTLTSRRRSPARPRRSTSVRSRRVRGDPVRSR